MAKRPNKTKLISRHAEPRVVEALGDTRIVAIVGPRQSGKTTLARKMASERGMEFVTLDDEQFRQLANDDPSGFVRDIGTAVIDEIQRAPGLILALKKIVDENPEPGQFLITGSVDLFAGTISPDSLAGRVETIELLPFSQAEIERASPPEFLIRAFSSDFPTLESTGRTSLLVRRVITGGYPEGIARESAQRRQSWLSAYAKALTTRDVADIADVTKQTELSRLIIHASVASGQTVNLTAMAGQLGVDVKTVDRWLTLLEQLFVVRRIPAWHRNDVKRLTKAPKLHFLDSGLLSALRRHGEQSVKNDRTVFGSLLEGFVYSELLKQQRPDEQTVFFSHYRDRDQVEVDFVLESGDALVGIEVKSSASASPQDFRGLKRLRDATGESFVCGIMLHDGDRIQKAGDRLFSMPIKQLWS